MINYVHRIMFQDEIFRQLAWSSMYIKIFDTNVADMTPRSP